jgi:hypothetical protein
MGFFDKIKKFATGSSTATVAITEINGKNPADAVIAISDGTARGRMTVTALQDCTMLGMNYEVLLRTQDPQGQWGNIGVGSGKHIQRRDMKVGEVVEHEWVINEIDVETYLRNQSYNDLAAVPGHPKIKLLVRCTSDVEGSPFDPDAEAEVKIGASTAGPCKIETTVVEGNPASIASFTVTDSVCKGTVVVTAKAPCELTATRYELWLEMATKNGPVEALCAKNQNPELKVEGAGWANMSVSFGGTNITFPNTMGKGDKATQTWSIHSLDLPAILAANGFADPQAAIGNPDVKFVVRTFADVAAGGVSKGRTEVKLA